MPTYGDIINARFSELGFTASRWEEMVERLASQREVYEQQVEASARVDEWQGLSAGAAVNRFRETRETFAAAEEEAGVVAEILRTARDELTRLKGLLTDAVSQAEAAGMTVNATTGRATYDLDRFPEGSRDLSHQDPEFQRQIVESEAAWTAEIRRWVDAITEYDVVVRTSLERATHNDTPFFGFNSGAEESIIPMEESPEHVHTWWQGLSEEQRAELIERYPDVIGNLDGIPAVDRDQANRLHLPQLIDALEGRNDADSQRKLEGLQAIEARLGEDTDPPMYLLGIGDEGNGRAIISFGNPDEAQNVSAYVPGLDTRLDANFAGGTVDRALYTAQGARENDPSSAAIVWLGYDAPILGEGAGLMPDGFALPEKMDVMSKDHARSGAPAYQRFLDGINVTNSNEDPHVTAIGHSYGSLTLAMATQEEGGVAADDIIIVGSPGLGVDHAEDLGVGADHVYVGAADNDVVTRLPSPEEAAGGAGGMVMMGPLGAYLGGRLMDVNDNEIWFGRDPASESFGAQRFRVDDGMTLLEGGVDAHSNYFNPGVDPESAENIAFIVAGLGDQVSRQEYR
ncbi:alpha/beta hydrolase [Streptomyces mayteni]